MIGQIIMVISDQYMVSNGEAGKEKEVKEEMVAVEDIAGKIGRASCRERV